MKLAVPTTPKDFMRRARRRALQAQTERWLAANPETASLIDSVRDQKLTYISRGGLRDLAWVTTRLDRDGVAGEIIEAGTALGGSAVVLARSKASARPLRIFDTFGRIPEPGDRDGADVHERYEAIFSGASAGIDGDIYYGYRTELLEAVVATLEAFGVNLRRDRTELVQGVFQETLTVPGPVALAHVDADWYDSVNTCLQTIHPALAVGGRFVIDDYGSWSGARQAVDDFLAGPHGRKYRMEWRSRLHLVRRSH